MKRKRENHRPEKKDAKVSGGLDLRRLRKLFRKGESDLVAGTPAELHELARNWRTLSRRAQEAILVMGGVRRIPRANSKANTWRYKRGATREWLAEVLVILKESNGYLTDTEIAKRVGVNPSTLCRNDAYQNAKRTFLQRFPKPGAKVFDLKDINHDE